MWAFSDCQDQISHSRMICILFTEDFLCDSIMQQEWTSVGYLVRTRLAEAVLEGTDQYLFSQNSCYLLHFLIIETIININKF